MSVEKYDLNAIITKLSSWGKYQKRNFFLISLAVIYSAVQYSYVFSTRSTKHRCLIDECEDANSTLNYNQTWIKHAIPFNGENLRKCERYAPLTNISHKENESFCGAKAFDSSKIQKCDRFVTDGDVSTTIEQEFKLTCEENLWKLTALGSLDEIAEVLFSPIIGYLSDRQGRKWVLIYCLVISGVSGAIKSLSSSYVMFAIMEFITACFTSGIYGSGFILGVELLVAEERVFGSTVIAAVFPIGEIFIGLAAWFSPSWRFMLMVLYAPGILFLCYFWLMDDSLRFLIATGKHKRARRVIKRIGRANKVDITRDIQFELVNTGNNADNHGSKTSLSKEYDDGEPRETFLQMFGYPTLILRVLNCSLSWISCTFIYYGLTVYSVSLTGNIYLNFIIMSIIELPGYILCYFTLDSLGRRFTLVGSLIFSGIACLSCALIPQDYYIVQLTLPILGKFAATVAFKTIYIYTAEMFPTTLRHTFLAFCSMFGRAGSIAAPQLPLLATVSPFLPPVLFGMLGLVAGILALFLPETAGCKLPDTLEESLVIGKLNDIETDKLDKSI